MCMTWGEYVRICVDALRGWRHQIPLKVELYAIVSCLTQVLKLNSGPLEK